MSPKKYLFVLAAMTLVACKNEKQPAGNEVQAVEEQPLVQHNSLTETEKSEGWMLLFDGNSTNGWHIFNKPDDKPVWEAKDGVLVLDPLNGTGLQGDLVTDAEFGNFEFTFEWMLSKNGNSGVFINVLEGPDYNMTWQTGPEYQLLDPSHLDQAVEVKRAGCLYNYAPQLTSTDTNPAGQWNSSRILQKDGKVEFYLNGNLTAKADFTSPEWQEWVTASGFKNFSQFGKATKGHIALQQWTSQVWFRNLKIREL